MTEKSIIYISDDNQLLPIPKTGLLHESLSDRDRDYEKEKAVIVIKKDLPADHLTATYWG